MALVHISYDAKKSADSDQLRHDIPKRFLETKKGVVDFSEPTRSTFRFVINESAVDCQWIRDVMAQFEQRCYFFISACDSYTDKEKGKSLWPSLTRANKALDDSFQKILETIKHEIEESAGF